ncbi:MAG: hypothetical protein ONB46_11655 [candidate division KSB1 bacterium]|nr:hypothetical protein [candidate division KSB1 bacterium]MDZ7366651.1 hypothetical protein [candidate division KSB1 bacterium]MDZ7404662.1 hypothetical protein [candidate division KSB1 bacterium]
MKTVKLSANKRKSSHIINLRPESLIKDDVIPTLPHKAVQPILVTMNVTDFWKKVRLHRNFCIVTLALTQDEIDEMPQLLRRLFRLPEFKTKASRMRKVVHVTHNHIEYYESDRRIHSLSWHD